MRNTKTIRAKKGSTGKAGAKLKRTERRFPKPKAEGSSPSVPSIFRATMSADLDYCFIAPSVFWTAGGISVSDAFSRAGRTEAGRIEFPPIIVNLPPSNPLTEKEPHP